MAETSDMPSFALWRHNKKNNDRSVDGFPHGPRAVKLWTGTPLREPGPEAEKTTEDRIWGTERLERRSKNNMTTVLGKKDVYGTYMVNGYMTEFGIWWWPLFDEK